jgi:hypothetical protein
MDKRAQDYLAFCQAIGHIIVTWSLIERQIDQWVNIFFKNCGGKLLRKDEDIPAQFKQKREFIKDCCNSIAELYPIKDECLDLLHRASNLSEKRNDIIHGTIVGMCPPDRIFRIQVLKAVKDNHEIKEFKFNPSDYPKFEKSLSGLLTEAIAFSEKLAD